MPAAQFADPGTAMNAVRQMVQQLRAQLKAEGHLRSGRVNISILVTCEGEEPIEVQEALN